MTAQEIRAMQRLIYGDPPTTAGEAHGRWVEPSFVVAFAELERCALAAEHNELMVQWMKTAQPVAEEVALVRAHLDHAATDIERAETGVVVVAQRDVIASLLSAVTHLSEALAIVAGERSA